MLVILTSKTWNLRIILIYISLMTKDVDCTYLNSAIRDASLKNSLFSSVLHFKNGLLLSSFLSSLYVLDISLLSDAVLVKIFSYSVGCCFVLLIVSFAL